MKNLSPIVRDIHKQHEKDYRATRQMNVSERIKWTQEKADALLENLGYTVNKVGQDTYKIVPR